MGGVVLHKWNFIEFEKISTETTLYIFSHFILFVIFVYISNEKLALKNSISGLTIKEDKGTISILWDNAPSQSGENNTSTEHK